MLRIQQKMELVEAKGIGIKNPFTMEMKETDYLKANYMMMCRVRQDL